MLRLDNLNWIPRDHMEEGEDRLFNGPCDFHTWDMVTVCMHACVHIYNQQIYKLTFDLKCIIIIHHIIKNEFHEPFDSGNSDVSFDFTSLI